MLYFTNDAEMQGPASEETWHDHLKAVHRQLGLPTEAAISGVINIFVDTQEVQ